MTIYDVIFPKANILHSACLVVAFGFLTALCSKIAIYLPFSPVPITGQTFAVLLAGVLLGSKRGALSQVVYVGSGILGLPVFAPGTWGIAALLGPTGGYLIGFVFAAYVVGLLAERGWDRRFFTAALAMSVGSAIMYIFGLARLSAFIPSEMLLVSGLYPFILGDVIKIGLAAAVLPSGWMALRATGR
jgi:biotin transport system substrate-specific component